MTLKRWLPVLAVALLGCGGSQRGAGPVYELRGDLIDISVRARGNAFPIYTSAGEPYLLGEPGSNYEIWVANRSQSVVEAVVSVDGRDVISGRVADYRADRGYVLLPGEEVAIEGFRRSLDQVAAFEFVSVEESYASRMGDARNVGVIGVAVFPEAPPPPPEAQARIAEAPAGGAAQPAPAAEMKAEGEAARASGAAADAQGIGTGYGAAVGSQAEIVPFRRAEPEQPAEVIRLFYDDRAGLEARGIVIVEEPARPAGPDPFPGAAKSTEFAPPPPAR